MVSRRRERERRMRGKSMFLFFGTGHLVGMERVFRGGSVRLKVTHAERGPRRNRWHA